MRSSGKDIVEIFGYKSDDLSLIAKTHTANNTCPFLGQKCSKTNHDKTIIYGVCSVSKGASKDPTSDVIICPNRLYASKYMILKNAADAIWGAEDYDFICGGDVTKLKSDAMNSKQASIVVAFGKGSGKEIVVTRPNLMSMDWVLQRYERTECGKLIPLDFVGIEVQSIDITGNYRDAHSGYISLRQGNKPVAIQNSGHGLNWANVHKRLIPQIVRKGNIYQECDRCSGFFFILPDEVFKKFEDTLGQFNHQNSPDRKNISVMTYSLGVEQPDGIVRDLVQKRVSHLKLSDVKDAFSKNQMDDVHVELNQALLSVLSD